MREAWMAVGAHDALLSHESVDVAALIQPEQFAMAVRQALRCDPHRTGR